MCWYDSVPNSLYSVVSDINDINDIHTNGSLGYKWGYNDTKWDIYIPMILSSFMTHGGIPKTMKPWQPWDDLGGKPVNPQLWPN